MIDPFDKRMLNAMVDKCNKLILICDKHSKTEIQNNFILGDAVLYEFEKLYEDSTRLSLETLVSFPKPQIGALRAIRNRVAHNYESVSLDLLFEIINKDIPILKQLLIDILKE